MVYNKVICDTNIISQYLDGKPGIVSVIDDIRLENIVITPVVYIELVRWLSVYKGFTSQERRGHKLFFDSLKILHLNEKISKLAVEISSNNNSIDVADILIGATAVYHNIPVYTMNKKHFKQIKGINLL